MIGFQLEREKYRGETSDDLLPAGHIHASGARLLAGGRKDLQRERRRSQDQRFPARYGDLILIGVAAKAAAAYDEAILQRSCAGDDGDLDTGGSGFLRSY